MSTILCIEDEVEFRENIVELLQSEGYDTLEAGDGKEGLNILQSNKPDLVLCDVKLPQVSGFDILREMNKHKNESYKITSPFVFLTASDQKNDKITGINLQAEDYLVKPVDFDILLTTIRSRLSKYKTNTMTQDNHYLPQFGQDNYLVRSLFDQEIGILLENITKITQNIETNNLYHQGFSYNPKELWDSINHIKKIVHSTEYTENFLKTDVEDEVVVIDDIFRSIASYVSRRSSQYAKEINIYPTFMPIKMIIDYKYFTKAIEILLSDIVNSAQKDSIIDISISKCTRSKRYGADIMIRCTKINSQNLMSHNLEFVHDVFELHGAYMRIEQMDNTDILDVNIMLPKYRTV